ncbi:glycosyltransferase family 4 protein [uncultured Mailhella sp.]|uniref:glycosyltransferase family 4 protein n=1 Tax=uncultured Mailhella sp. TaxID=1981031 RepID=UPI002611039D|nr:glycosyltransferase family 4 protein [uncultured Mailhella sp.]
MRVLMFGWEYPPAISGGLGTACHGISTGLVARGTDLVFILPRLDGREPDEGVYLRSASGTPVSQELKKAVAAAHSHVGDRLNLRPVPSRLTPYGSQGFTNPLKLPAAGTSGEISHLHGGYHDDLMEEIYRYADAASAIAVEEHRRRPADLIHAHDWMTFPAAIAASEVTGLPFVAHLHATEFDRCGEHGYDKIYAIEKNGLQAADHVIAVSERTRQMAITRYGVNPDKISVVYNGVSPLAHKPISSVPPLMQEEKRVLFMGRITWQKGPGFFVDAARLVLDQMPDVRFIMAGSGDLLKAMIERAAALRIGSRFHFTGFLRGEEIQHMYAISSLYVMPSVSEPFGITPLEALQCGIPILLSRQCGCAEVLPGARSMDYWDVRGMAGHILELLGNPGEAARSLALCQEELKALTWERAVDGILNAYEHV